ncbi:MAG: DUF2911 domain-containing protein [Cyclobacteriaceae bacterium]
MKNILSLSALLMVLIASAQISIPPYSPTFKVSGRVGLSEVELEYSRPSARGREVKSNLIPEGSVWRTGANASTKITFSDKVSINENEVAAGTYALYTIFDGNQATIILSKNLTWWGSLGYDEAEDYLRFEVPVEKTSFTETFTIGFSDFQRNAANLNLIWGEAKLTMNISTDVDGTVAAQIQATLIDNSSENLGDYYQGASYYYDTERDADLALKWISKVIDESDEERYWNYHLKAKILARLGKKKACIETANKSIELATAAGNPDYVNLNNQLIEGLE